MDHVDEETRAVAEQLLQDGLAAIADARAAEQTTAAKAPAKADVAPEAGERTRKS